MSDKSFEGFAIVELLGHVRLAGRVTPAPMFGTELLRIDIPDREGAGYTTQFISGSSLYRITPCGEEVARAVARENDVIPVSPWELRRLEAPKMVIGETSPTEFFYGRCPACGVEHTEREEVLWLTDELGRYFYCPNNGNRVDVSSIVPDSDLDPF